jgi:hypothetical protein
MKSLAGSGEPEIIAAFAGLAFSRFEIHWQDEAQVEGAIPLFNIHRRVLGASIAAVAREGGDFFVLGLVLPLRDSSIPCSTMPTLWRDCHYHGKGWFDSNR